MSIEQEQNIDRKELSERKEAAKRLFAEEPEFFVSYGEECFRESRDQNQMLRKKWKDTWNAYLLKQDYSHKEDWQSKITTAKPFSTVQQAKSIVQKAMGASEKYFRIEPINPEDLAVESALELTERIMQDFMSDAHGRFRTSFLDAVEMAFVTGQSMEMIPRFQNGRFSWILTPPWRIFRDPNAKTRDPQSGNYWIRAEWIDEWVLRDLADRKVYNPINYNTASSADLEISPEEEAELKQQVYAKNAYINSFLVKDFWGTIVSKQGEVIIPDGHFTYTQQNILKDLEVSPYKNLRFPGISFSPIPNITRFEGRGLLEGVLKLWTLMNNLLNLHVDNLNWTINPMREISPDLLEDPNDLDVFPGKIIQKRSGYEQFPAIVPIVDKSTTSEALANSNFFEQLWQKSTFVNEFVEGLPGSRSEITKGEVEIKTEQALGVFNTMAKELDFGARMALTAAYEVISKNFSLTNPTIKKHTSQVTDDGKEIRQYKDNLFDYGRFRIDGVSNLVKRMDMVRRIEATMLKAESPIFGPMMEPDVLLKVYLELLDLDQYKILKPDMDVAATKKIIEKALVTANIANQSNTTQPQQAQSKALGRMQRLPQLS